MHEGLRLHDATPRYESLADYMAKTGATQVEVAAACGVSQPTVSRWLRGLCQPSRLRAVAAALGVDLVSLVPHDQEAA